MRNGAFRARPNTIRKTLQFKPTMGAQFKGFPHGEVAIRKTFDYRIEALGGARDETCRNLSSGFDRQAVHRESETRVGGGGRTIGVESRQGLRGCRYQRR